MLNSILYFEQFCIKNFEKLEDEFLKNPKNFAEYVFGLTDLLCKLCTEMLRDSLETMDRMLCESAFRRKSWTIEAHHTKTLVTSLGDVTFQKTLFLKQTDETTRLPPRSDPGTGAKATADRRRGCPDAGRSRTDFLPAWSPAGQPGYTGQPPGREKQDSCTEISSGHSDIRTQKEGGLAICRCG